MHHEYYQAEHWTSGYVYVYDAAPRMLYHAMLHALIAMQIK